MQTNRAAAVALRRMTVAVFTNKLPKQGIPDMLLCIVFRVYTGIGAQYPDDGDQKHA